jgi:anti-sigma B factor antagonist
MRENPKLQTPSFAAPRHEDDLGAVTVVLTGELDMATAPRVDHQLRRAEGEARHVILDLRRLEFIDSSGLHLIMAAQTRIREAGGRLSILRAQPHVHRIFQAARLDKLLEIVDQPPAATGRSVIPPALRPDRGAGGHPPLVRCPACRGTIAASEASVEVNGCNVHVACAREGVYEDVPSPDWPSAG